MKPIKEVCASFQLEPKRYRILKNVTVVESDDKQLVFKKQYQDKKDLYRYLEMRGFHYFPPLLGERAGYEIYPYIEEAPLPREQKALDLMYVISLLHNKTTFYRTVDLNQLKKFYEEQSQTIDYLFQYYQDLQTMIEGQVYMSPSEYLWIRNSSLFYQQLNKAKELLENWYQLASKQKKERYALVHHHLSLDHFIEKENGYLISWDQAKMDLPIYDFYSFYEENTYDFDYTSLFEVYNAKYPLLKEEKLRLFLLLLIPHKIQLQKEEIKSCRSVYQELKRMEKVGDLISKQYKENAKE